MNLFGFEVSVLFLIDSVNTILAYAWHYDEKRALSHLNKIEKFHNIKGEVVKSSKLELWLERKVKETVIDGIKFDLPSFNYRNRLVYENIINIPKGKTSTYAEIARKSGLKYTELLTTLMRNPFQILIPCHRLLTNKGTLLGFYPLGKDVKEKLLKIESQVLHS